MNLERLEDRTLLDGGLVNADILAVQRDGMLAGLQGLTDWTGSLGAFNRLAQPITLVNQRIGEALNFTDTLQRGFKDPVAAYFAGDSTPTTDELVTALRNLTRTYTGNLEVTVSTASVSGGIVTPARDEMHFHLGFQAVRTLTVPINLGSNADGLSLDAAATVTLRASLTFNFAFGYDLTPGLAPANAFFVRVGGLTAGVSVHASSLNFGAKVGFLDLRVQGPTSAIDLDANVAVGVNNVGGHPRSNVTLTDLQGTALSALVTLTPSGSLSATLPITATLGSYTFPGAPSITLAAADLFSGAPPTVTVNGFGDLVHFNRITPVQVLQLLHQFGDWLGDFRNTSVFAAAVPFAGRTLADVLRHADAYRTKVPNQLQTGVDLPSFSSAQTLATRLATALGQTVTDVSPLYDPATRSLTYRVRFTQSLAAATAPFAFAANLGALAGLSTSATLTLNAGVTLDMTIGINLSPMTATMQAIGDGPANGRITADANFSLALAGGAPVPVTLTAAATSTNNNLDDLAADLNAALSAAGLSAQIVAGRTGNRLTFATVNPNVPASLRLITGASDPTFTQLRFPDGLAAEDVLTRRLFVQDATAGGTVMLSASGVNSSAKFGFLEVTSTGGTATGTGALTLRLKDPATGTVGGRVSLSDLIAAVRTNVNTIVAPPTFTGSASVTLPNVAVVNNLLGTLPGNPTITLTMPDVAVPGTVNPSFNSAFDPIRNFENVNSTNVLDSLRGVQNYLTTLSGFSFLNLKLPGVSKSVSELLDYAGRFVQFVNAFQNNPAGALQQLMQKLRDALPAGAPLPTLSVTPARVLRIDLTWRPVAVNQLIPLDLDLNLGGGRPELAGLTSLVSASGNLRIAADVTFNLHFGLDLNAGLTAAQRPVVFDTTGMVITALVNNESPLFFGAGLGPLGIFVRNGSVQVRRDTAGLQPASFTVGLNPNPGGGNRYRVVDLTTSNATVALTGRADIVLPLYFPTNSDSSPLGGAPPANHLRFTIGELRNIPGTTTIAAPDLRTAISDIDFTNNLGLVFTGLHSVLGVLQSGLQSRVLGKLPLVGSALSNVGDFLEGVRTAISNLPDRAAEAVRLALFRVLGPAPGLGLLARLDCSAGVPTDADVRLVLGAGGAQFNVCLKTSVTRTTPIGFDLGLPFLGLQMSGNIVTTVGFTMRLGFGATRTHGFYFDTSPTNELELSIQTTPTLSATGRLLFLRLTASDVGGPDGTQFGGSFIVDVRDPNRDGKFTIPELTSLPNLTDAFDPRLTATAIVHLNLTADFGSGEFPSISARFRFRWGFDSADPLTGGRPEISFTNVRLQLGSFFSKFLGPVIREIKKVIDPIKPILKFLNTPVPVISDIYQIVQGRTLTPLELLRLDGNDVTVIEVLNFIANNLNVPPDGMGGTVGIDMGDFDLGTHDVRAGGLSGASPRTLRGVADSLDQMLGSGEAGRLAKEFLDAITSNLSPSHPGGFDVPLLRSPTRVFELLLGKDVPLFTFRLPTFDKFFGIDRFFHLLGPLGVRLTGGVRVVINVGFGFDTYGFRKFVQSCETTCNPLEVFKGFYVSDRFNPDGTGDDVPEIHLEGTIYAAAGANAIIVEVGGGGGLFATVDFNLNDPDRDGKVHLDELIANFQRGPQCIFDVAGKITAVLELYAKFGICPFCKKISYNIVPPATISDFSHGCAPTPPPPPQLAWRNPLTGELRLNVGTFASQRYVERGREDEVYRVRHKAGAAGAETIIVEAFGFSEEYANISRISADFGSRNDILTMEGVLSEASIVGGDGNDTLHASDGPATLRGGRGNDVLVGGGNNDLLAGDEDDDTLIGGGGNDMLFGGEGHNLLQGGLGNDTLTGGGGNDTLDGDDGDDSLVGGNGNDQLSGGAGRDSLYGGEGHDLLDGGEHDDLLDGGAGNDALAGEGGNDTIYAGLGDDTVEGGAGHDSIEGQGGADRLYGQAGNDTIRATGLVAAWIEGGAGNNSLIGGDGNDVIYAHSPGGTGGGNTTIIGGGGHDYIIGSDGRHTISGGAGSDTILGGEQGDSIDGDGDNDFLYGGDGPDTIHGGGGNDLIRSYGGNDLVYADAGNDSIYGGAGHDTLYGAGGADLIYGSTGNDCIFGGGGIDQLYGQAGNDTITGQGTDGVRIEGGAGDNSILGSDGPDLIYGDAPGNPSVLGSRNTVWAAAGNDTVLGGEGVNEIHGGADRDYILGGRSNDSIWGDAGHDTVFGNAGDDVIRGGLGDDQLYGNSDRDLIYTDDGNDTVWGGIHHDTLIGGAGNQVFYGEQGNDRIYAGTGSYYVDGGEDNDFIYGGMSLTGATILGGLGDDYIVTGQGPETIYGGIGDDLLAQTVDGNQSLNNTTLTGRGTKTFYTLERFLLTGGPSANAFDFSGFTGVATVVGAGGPDRVTSTDNVDFTLVDGHLTKSDGGRVWLVGITHAVLTGGVSDNAFDVTRWTGTGHFDGGLAFDRLVASNDADFILGAATLTRSTGGSFTFANVEGARISGGPGNNRIDASGFTGNASLYGGAGNDTVLGGAGDDYLDGGIGVDLLEGGAGGDVLVARASASATLVGGAGDDVIHGSDGGDNIQGGAGHDRIYGNAGPDLIQGGTGADTIDGGTGNDTIYGDAGADLLLGGAGNDVLYSFNPGAGDDGAVNYVYGDFGTNANEAGSGNDMIAGGTGNDLLFGEGGTNSIIGGGPGALLNNLATGTASAIPPVPVPAPADWPPVYPGAATLPAGADGRGRWTELAGSATLGGLSNTPGLAAEPSIAAGSTGRYVAWADTRGGQYQINVARHTAGGWQQLAGSAQFGGISSTTGPSRRPSIAIDVSGQPRVAWTTFNGGTSDIFLARYDNIAGAWVALGGSLGAGGISGTGAADNAVVVVTPSGPVVAWMDRSAGAANVYVKQFNGSAWVELGAGGASGGGVSGSASDVRDLVAAMDGTKVAIAWTQQVGGLRQIYLKEYNGGTWNALGGSASGNGLSNTAGVSQAASIAYLGGMLFAAYQTNTTGAVQEIYARTFNGTAWVPAGTGAASGGGVSRSDGESTRPVLSVGGGRLYLGWLDNRVPNFTGNATALYVKRWSVGDGAFVEELPGDASHRGVGLSVGSPQTPALSVDSAGRPFVAWNDLANGKPQVYMRGNLFTINRVFYVNDGSRLSDAFARAVGNDTNSGTNPDQPKASIQGILDAHTLQAGDVILVDAGVYPDSFILTAAHSGVLIAGSPSGPAVLGGTVFVTGASGIVLSNLTFQSNLLLTNTTNVTVADSHINGNGVTVSGGSGAHVVHNVITSGGTNVTLTGGTTGVVVEHNVLRGGTRGIAVTGTGATGLEVRGNRIHGSGTGIALLVAASGHVGDNEVGFAGTALEVAAAFTGLIERNDLHHSGTGLRYLAAARVNLNRIHHNSTGVFNPVNSATDGFGLVSGSEANEIYENTVGVNLTGLMHIQHIFSNSTGVTGSGRLVSTGLETANVIELNNVGVDFVGTVQFQRIARNTTGVIAKNGQLLAHNLIYGNTVRGITISGVTDVRIFHNTVYQPTGDLIRIENRASIVEVRNNILWVGGGYGIYVANDSIAGFFSDYNLLHATGTGKLVWWTKDFTDLLDWQEDVYRFDLHSLGYTVVNPDWSNPRFMAVSLNDFRVFDPQGRLRYSSPTLDTGDPLADQALPASARNLLANPGFESDLTGWSVTPSGGTRLAGPAPWEGGRYFFAGPIPVATIEQSIDLIAAGYTVGQIDGQNMMAVFGGRVRSANEGPRDAGTITLAFLDGSGSILREVTARAANTSDRWELIGGRNAVPAGTRRIRFRFTAVRNTGGDNDAYLDGAFLYVHANTVAPNLGAFGNTPAEDGQFLAQHLVLRSPDLYRDWERDKPLTIRWDSFGNVANAPVRIDLYQDTANGPLLIRTLAASIADTGEFTWIPSTHDIAYATYGLRIQISLIGNINVLDRAAETFTVPENTNTFYVNDASTINDEYTTARGSNRNTGKLSGAPKPYPNNVLRIYALGPTQTLYVDTGDYPLLSPLVISAIVGVGDDRAFTMTGPTGAGRTATLRHANPFTVAPVIELYNAHFTTLSRLTIRDGQMGVWAHDGSRSLTLTYLDVRFHTLDGIRVEADSSVTDLGFVTAFANGRYGIYLDAPVGRLHDSTITYNADTGLYLNNVGSAAVEANRIANNRGYGIYVANFVSGTTTVIGNLDVALGRGNRVLDNTRNGIYAYYQVQVAGNTVAGHANLYNFAIYLLNGAQAVRNVVHGNYRGIHVQNGGVIRENRVYNNAEIGVLADYGTSVIGNVIYSNGTGLYLNYTFSGPVENNLIYANQARAILIPGGGYSGPLHLVNNTIYQPTGDGIRVEGNTRNVRLRNNIIWTLGGFGISVADDSQLGFVSDVNLLYATGTGQVGLWQSVGRSNLTNWRNAVFQDQNSVGRDPLFVSVTGADGVLGYQSAVNDGRDDDFHEKSLHGSYKGGALAPVLNLATGTPIYVAPVLSADTQQSPAIDRGDLTDGFTNEPANHGNFVNLGVYGNTAQASKSPAQYVLVTAPEGAEVWPMRQTFPVRWRTQDLSRYALSFNGTNQYVQTGATTVMQNRPLTLEAWVRPDLRADGTDFPTNVLSNDQPGQGGHGFGVNVWAAGSQLKVQHSGGFRVVPGASFTAGQWVHVAVVYTSGNVKTYVNGALADDFSFTQGTQTGTNLIRVGIHNHDSSTYGTRRFFKGTLDEVRVWSAARSLADIQTNRARLLDGTETGLATYYRLDEGRGLTAIDRTALAAHATLSNGYQETPPLWVSSTVPIGITVKLDLMRDGNPIPVLTIAESVPNNGEFSWLVPQGLTAASNYRVRVTRNEAGSFSGLSVSPFTINVPISVYHVNDATVVAGDWTTAAGNDANNGLTAATPLPSIQAVLSRYQLSPGDVIRVDNGTYNLTTNLILTASQAGVKIEGYHETAYPTRRALLNRGNVSGGSYAVELRGANDVTLDYLHITGAQHGVYASNSSRSLRVTVSNSTVYGNSENGIWLEGSNDFATITGNRLYGIPGGAWQDDQDYGIAVAGTDATISRNTAFDSLYHAGIWVRGLRHQVRDNVVYQNAVGIDASSGTSRPDRIIVAGNTARNNTREGINAYSAVLVTGNTVHNNQTGISAYFNPAEVVDNTAYANVTGIYGSNDSLVRGNSTYSNTGAGLSAGNYNNTFVGNTSYGNRWGLVVGYYFSGTITNNAVYGNTEVGIGSLSGNGSGYRIVSNTVYQPTGDAIKLVDSRNVTVLNNILWVQAGFALSVNPNSEVGFRSDYNDLVATGTGRIAQWAGRTFATRADWFYEVGHDAHSLSVNPRFVNPTGGDFHLQSDSPAIDRGDPNDAYTNEPRPHGGRINLGNYGNTPEAATSPSQLVQVLSPSGLEKLQIGQTVGVTWRTAGLFAPTGYYRDTILADTPYAYYRLGENGGTSASDTSGQSRHGTYVGGVRLDNLGALPADQDTAAFFDGTDDHVQLPTGFADFRTGFTAEVWAYPTSVNYSQRFFDLGNGPYSDNIILARNDSTNGLVFQAYNGSSGGVQVIAPNAIELNKWQHFAVTLNATGQVTLYKNGTVIATGTTSVPRNVTRTRNYLGRNNWYDTYYYYAGSLDEVAFYNQALPAARIQAHYARSVYGTVNIDLMRAGDPPTLVRNIATGVANTGSFNWTIPSDLTLGNDFQVRVRANEGALPQGLSGETFLVANGGNRYYVNDGATTGDVFTTAVGNNANSGKTPDQPLASLPALLSAYSFRAGDTVFVDTGNYNLIRNIVLEARHAGVRIQGPSSTVALFNRGNVSSGSYVFELSGASDVTLDRLSITGGQHGVYASNTSRSLRVTVSNSTVYGNDLNGIWLESTNDFATITGNRLYGIPGGAWQDDQDTGIAVGGNDATVRNNTAFDHLYYAGIWVRGLRHQIRDNVVFQNAYGIDAAGGTSRPDRIVVAGNTARNNTREGINASSAVLVTGNTVHNNTTGISAYYSPAEVADNNAYANVTGIYGSNAALIQGNRTYNNTGAGLSAGNYDTTFVGNTSYGNRWGMVVAYYFGGRIANNLLYNNSERGALIQAGGNSGFDFVNNTVYQTVGDAVRVENTRNLRMRNNILMAHSGYVFHVDSGSQVGMRSDYNLFRAAGTAKLGSWQGRDFTAQPTWFYETGQDVHSLVSDPGFVNAAGGDFHLQSGSLAIDRGDPNDAYTNEPRPHGGRVNLGNYGNTSEATTSVAQTAQVLGPTGLEKLQIGQTVPVTWRTSGIYAPAGYYRDAILADTPYAYYRLGESSGTTASDASGQSRHGTYVGGVRLDNPGALPAELDTAVFLDGTDDHVQLPSGFADFRTGFSAEVWAYPTAVNYEQRFFDLGNGGYADNILLNRESTTNNLLFQVYGGAVVRATNAIELNKWQHFAVTVNATGQVTLYKNGAAIATGTTTVPRNIVRTRNYLGLNQVYGGAYSYAGSLDEVAFYNQALPAARIQAHYARSIYGTVSIDLMRAGSPPTLVRNIATGVPNSGSFNWTIPSDLPLANNYLIRVQAVEGTQPQGLSPEAFLVANNGNRYYVNDSATAGDIYTTAVGNNANSGKTPDQPMANLATLLAAYNLQAGDTVYVDTGSYDLLRNVVVTARHAGITIQGAGAAAVLNRGLVTRESYVFEFQNAPRVTLNRLGVRGGYSGIVADYTSASTDLTVSNSTIFGNSESGIALDSSNDRATLIGNTLYGIPGGSGDDNQSYGISVNSADSTVANNTAYDHAYTGISTRGARMTVSGNNVYGNRFGMSISGTGTVVRENLVHDNIQTGLEVISGGIRAIGNLVYGQTAVNAVGISGLYDVELLENVVHTNYTGIYVTNGAIVRRNRVYNSTQVGISVGNYYNLIEANRVYSNRVGIATGYYFGGTISNNVLYANTNQGILFQSGAGYGSEVLSNTIYQPVGDGIRLQGSPNVRLRNNLIWVQAGYTLNVDGGSQSGFSSDRNLLHKGTDPNAHIGFWGGVSRTNLAAWQTASGQDAGSVSADPLFVDLDGADNVLGFARVGEVFRDGGPDDNFYLRKNSPAIDRGQSWGVVQTDVEGLPRRDDPGTANAGGLDYFGTTLGSSQFAATGTARNWRSDGTYWNLTLPFAFPFYDGSYTTVQVSTEGLLQFDRPGNEWAGDGANSTAKLFRSRRIAPLWDNLHTYGTGNDLFVDTSVSGQVKIRWNATNQADNSTVNVAVVLFSDGRIRFDYGPGNTNLTPTVGVSFGNNLNAQFVAGHDGAAALTNANSVQFQRQPGISDIGAFEFRGSSLDVTPPRVVSTEPAVIHGGGSAPQVYQVRVTFSEELNTLDATAPAAYELRKAGSGGFGSPDDVVYSLTPRYTPGSTTVVLDVNGLPGRLLPTGTYRLTILSNATTSIHDLAGLRLDGMNTGTEGGNYVRIFSLIEARADLAVSMAVDRPRPLEGSTVRYTVTLDNNGPHAATRVELRDVLPAGLTFVSAMPSVGIYNRTTGIWTVDSLASATRATLVLTATVNAGTLGQTLTNTATVTQLDQLDPTSGNNSASAAIIVQPSVATRFIVSGFPSPITAGTPGTITVSAQDVHGNVITGYRGTVQLTSTDGQAVLPANYTFLAGDNGVKTFSITLRTAALQAITVTDTVVTSLTGSQTDIQVNPAAASLLVLIAPETTRAGDPMELLVVALDPYGNVATGYRGTVTFATTDPLGGILPADYTFTEADNGGVFFPDVYLFTAGIQTILVTDTLNGSLTWAADVLVVPTDPAFFYVEAPLEVYASVPFDLLVVVYDAYGNVVSEYTGTVTFTSTDPGAVLPPDYTFAVEDGGVATFTGTTTLFAEGEQEIIVTDLALGIEGRILVNVLPSPGPGSGPNLPRGRGRTTAEGLLRDRLVSVLPSQGPDAPTDHSLPMTEPHEAGTVAAPLSGLAPSPQTAPVVDHVFAAELSWFDDLGWLALEQWLTENNRRG